MLNLINTEIYKLKRQKLIIVLFVAVIAISAFSAFSEINLLSTPDDWINGKKSFANAFQDVFMLFVIAIFAGFYIGSDFTNRTIQAELSRGHKRFDIIFSKAVVFSIGAGFVMLLYPITVCIIHTIKFGWGEPFNIFSFLYLCRVAFLGSILNIGTSNIYVCFAFLCRDIPKTICVCFAFPIVFSAISSNIGKQIPAIGKLFDYSTLSQLKYIVSDKLLISTLTPVILSTCITIVIALILSNYFFSNAEIK
ncbi:MULTISPECIES: ABC transporter permease [unclassified Clostridioides]|uniref:ABC transporter permease n=1 Tax=unclassified Clostridioides TaxID=2635829 RepID=UPI001D112425|nr:ABC transporter permease [Clostridioides sp. ES-S-0171-01]MCC0687994.1 ABC transporter permease [Clostridioides sp. ES-S-0056-01]MCC0715210.1 ABC transporter permease [Clostridioides sp. ES-S-0077-01]UDN54909.1 ABC transporter permease [Clostridioides sp. ES-S-0054-01]